MKAATYCGPVAHLRGKTALVRQDGPDHLKAQFDDHELSWGGDRLAYGWHSFDTKDFTIHQEIPNGQP